MKTFFGTLTLLFLFPLTVFSQGIIIGPDARPSALTLQNHTIDVNILEQVAVVTVMHQFQNQSNTTIEGNFLFPLPQNAHVSHFSMTVDGKEMKGELLEADEARRIYEDIVRQSLDPALLEMADYRTFRAGIFPIPPGASRTITLRYDATLAMDANTVTFQYPLQGRLSARHTPRPMPLPGDRPLQHPEDLAESRVEVKISTSTALKNIYSPSHLISIAQQDDKKAMVTLDQEGTLDGHDFVLYYSLDASEIGATALTHRPYSDQPGYFMMLLSPPFDIDESRIQPKDIVFILDTSGSMQGEKIRQAKEALGYALNRLGDRDRFGLVAFSSDVDTFRDDLTGATACDDALYFVDRLEASGGTNINDALLTALDMLQGSEQGMVIFLTDGLPSSGVTDEGTIRANTTSANASDVRIFSFGVGYDVNTRLLDGLSQTSGAFADYISPDESIEERVGTFYEKVRFPVMTDLSFKVTGIDGYAFAPNTLPDLYKGGQLILSGRYRKAGKGTLTLKGNIDGRQEQFRYTFNFPKVERERDFVGRLWATRRVGHLLDEIRMHGENEELKEEVITLAKTFGLVTPYTSYLVREEEAMDMADTGRRDRDQARSAATPSITPSPAPRQAMQQSTGASAVKMSKSIRAMQEAEVVSSADESGVTAIDGRTLVQNADGRWTDVLFDEDQDTVLQIPFLSETYFTFLRLYPEANDFAQLGDNVLFHFKGKYVEIGEEGEEKVDGATLKGWFK